MALHWWRGRTSITAALGLILGVSGGVAWIVALGWEPLVNRKGTTWRGLDEDLRAGVADAGSARALMLAHPSVIKRPVIEWPAGSVTVGFEPGRWPAS